jgi:hypothetical protein
MRINYWVGPYRFVYMRNDPIAGEVWIFEKDLDYIEWRSSGDLPTLDDLDRIHHGPGTKNGE